MNQANARGETARHASSHGVMDTHLHGCWLFVTRLLLGVLSIFVLVLYVIGTPAYLASLDTICTSCLDDRLTPDKLQALQAVGLSLTTYATYMTVINLLFALLYFAVAALIFWRKSDDWMALFACFTLVAF